MERTIWGIHAGRTGDADALFLKQNCVALGWHEMGDVSKVSSTREAFRLATEKTFPGKKPGWYGNAYGQIFRFVHEMAIGDLVVYPSKFDRLMHIGEVTGKYEYRPEQSAGYPQTRAVRWLKHVPRTVFSQGALYETGSAMSFFQIKNYAPEFVAVVEGKAQVIVPVAEDETVSAVTEDIEENTRDFLLKRLSQELKGHPLAEFVGHLLNTMGYRARVSPEGPDGGIDIIAHKDELGFEPPIIKVQVKSGDGSTGDPVVSALYGKVSGGEFGLLVTLGTITSQARAFERSKGNLRLIDGQQLVDLILEHYEQFDSRYKRLLPLKRAYVPAQGEDEA